MICAWPSRPAVLSFAAVTALAALAAAGPAVAKDRSTAEKKDPYALTTRTPGTPVLAVVSLDDQKVTIYDADGAILRAPVSTGQTGLETPVGIYSVLQKEAEHYSNRYDDAAMPNMERITWSGVAMHGGALPGYPASHGCIRMPYKFAERLFGLTKLGMRVIVARKEMEPAPISHPLLFKPMPLRDGSGLVSKTAWFGSQTPQQAAEARAASLQAAAAAKNAEADAIDKEAAPARAAAKKLEPDMRNAQKALRAAEKMQKRAAAWVADTEKDLARAKSDRSKARAQTEKDKADAKLKEAQAKLDTVKGEVEPKIDAYQQADAAAKALEDKRDAARAEAQAAQRKSSPVSVFISLKTQKLYVRQAFQPVFEAPVTIADPDKPIGTHTYTAVAYADGGDAMRWNVVSIGPATHPGDANEDVSYRSSNDDDYYDDDYYRPRRPRHVTHASSGPKPTDVAAAKAALDRITIPPDVAERISELVLPGSSLIVSDEETSKETGQQTDFIVLISSEPQGGILKRPPQMNPYYDDGYGYYDDYDRRGRRGRGPFGGGFFRFW